MPPEEETHLLTQANYQLVIDSLNDLTHVQAFPRIKCEVELEGDTVTVRLTFPNGRPPPFFTNAVPGPAGTMSALLRN